MKIKLTIAVLLIAFFVGQFGLLGFQIIEKHRIKKLAKKAFLQKLNKTQLDHFAEDTKGITWLEKNKEFKLNEEYYDIVHIENKNGKKIYYVVKDSFEKNEIAQLILKIKAAQEKHGDDKKDFSKFQQLLFFQKNYSKNLHYHTSISVKKYFLITENIVLRTIRIETPPPNLV